MAAPAAKTLRNLTWPYQNGCGIGQNGVATTSATNKIISFFTDSTFTTPATVQFKPGCVINLRPWQNPIVDYAYTIEGGAGSQWVLAQQPIAGTWYASTWGQPAFYTSYQTNTKSRGSTTQDVYGVGPGSPPLKGVYVPDETHFIYWSPLDDAGNPDYYVYVDTVAPERGVHPYTRDKAIGSFKTPPSPSGADVAGHMMADLSMRIKELEGVLRAGRPSGSKSQDYRIADLVSRFYNLEVWANSAGHFGTPPAPASNATYAERDFIANGDPA